MHGGVLWVVVVKHGLLSRLEEILPLVPLVSQGILVHGDLHVNSVFSLFPVLLIVRHGTVVVPQTRIASVSLHVDAGQHIQ